jgi:trehalose utilization protein
METDLTSDKIKVAVITGAHPFDVPGFYALFRSIPDIDFYIQSLDEFAFSGFARGTEEGRQHLRDIRRQYDCLVFYNFHKETPPMPGEEKNLWERGRREALEELGKSEQGILVLHHGILAFPQWQLWSDLCGIQDRSYTFEFNQRIRIEVANPDHPITKGLSSWEVLDETYAMNSAGEDSDILLTTDQPQSIKTIAWVRTYKNARVFCLQVGHDNYTFSDPNFRTVVGRGIRWVARRT